MKPQVKPLRKKRIAIDFDGVIYTSPYVASDYFGGPIHEPIKKLILMLHEECDLFIFTSRLSQEPDHPEYPPTDPHRTRTAMQDWLGDHGLRFSYETKLAGHHGVIAPPEWGKIGADLYIDDKAFFYQAPYASDTRTMIEDLLRSKT